MFSLVLFLSQEDFRHSIPLTSQKTKQLLFRDGIDASLSKDDVNQHTVTPEVHKNPLTLNKAATSEYVPKVHIIADYVM